ncbi:TRAP transporter large permease [Yanghanlia caeni]|uniref:TRAP transporter large permease protein n=1 Tax=Yanghanlia caeni TaxID=3064283 RepID=A0ABU1D5Q2_9BURK|nr:TRAP transporter large permease [Alcaligenaceae bacterium LG-2]HZH56238.1 TRAP transporter large permease [Burkholderiaceae bacterium]
MSEVAQMSLVSLIFLVLLMGGMWIPFAIAIAAVLYIYIASGVAGFNGLGLVSWGSTYSFILTAIPLFVLMAEFMLVSGLSQRVYRGLNHLVRFLPGGLLQTNVAGCAMFSAISGSSVATAAAIGSIALPQLEQRRYDEQLATGTIVAGGTLGILIPPSIAFIIYGMFTDTSISKLFMAGVLPGLVLVVLFMAYVGIRCMVSPALAPKGESDEPGGLPVRQVLADLFPFTSLILLVMGSLYLGFATPTEAAAVGACLAFVVAKIWGTLDWQRFRLALSKTVQVSATILFIVYSAYLFSYAVGMVGLTDELADVLESWELTQLQLLLLIILVYTVLGMLMDSIGMMVITIPVLAPIMMAYGFDLLWFGVLVVILIELGQITPPAGLNLFVVRSISRSSLFSIIKGSLPFCALLYVLIALLIMYPDLALWIPGRM